MLPQLSHVGKLKPNDLQFLGKNKETFSEASQDNKRSGLEASSIVNGHAAKSMCTPPMGPMSAFRQVAI